jgi:hypothetical protein
MADKIAFPFRLSAGRVVKDDSASDSYAAQSIAAVVRTGKGELILNLDYGVRSPEFVGLDNSALLYSVATYYPNIEIRSVVNRMNPQTGVVETRIAFDRS